MKINNLQYYNTNSYNNFKNNNNNEFIDKFLSKIKNPDDIKICFNYNDISFADAKTSTNNYIVKTQTSIENKEEDINSYYSISELLK